MSAISVLPSGIVAWLSEQKELSHITFMTEFPATKKAIPLKKAIVAVGLSEVRINDNFVGDGNETFEDQEFCRNADLVINLAIHVPYSYGGACCHDVFTDVVDCLTFATDLNIKESGCGNVTADRDTDAFVLKGFISISADFCPASSSDLNFKSFENHELLCGSHITDNDIHVTKEEKELWTSTFFSDYYSGNGAERRTFNLGYRPKFVFVFEIGSAPAVYDAATDLTSVNSGYANSDVGSLGILTTDNGFRVENGESNKVGKSVPYLNKSGRSYGYFVVR